MIEHVSSLPLIYFSKIIESAKFLARLYAPNNCNFESTMERPMVLPWSLGFTTSGNAKLPTLSNWSLGFTNNQSGVKIEFLETISLVLLLFMQIADETLSDPVKGTSRDSRNFEILPFSPSPPCRPLKTRSVSMIELFIFSISSFGSSI